MTVDERLFRIRAELSPKGNAIVTTPNGVLSVHHVCVCGFIRVINVFVCVCMHACALSRTKLCEG